VTSRSHTACRICGRNAHGGNDDHLCGKCWRAKRATERQEKVRARLDNLSARVVAEHNIGVAIAEAGFPRYTPPGDWIREAVGEGVMAAVQQGEISREELMKRSLEGVAKRHIPDLAVIVAEELAEPEEDVMPEPAVDHTARDANIIELYTQTPAPVAAICDAFRINVAVLYEVLRAHQIAKRGPPRGRVNGMIQQVDGRYAWADREAPASEAPAAPPEDLQAQLQALQAELATLRANGTAAAPVAPGEQQWRVSWQATRQGEEVVAAASMMAAVELVRQQIGGDVEVTGAVRE